MNEIQHAMELFDGHYNCSQAVFVPFAGRFGLTEEQAIGMAAGFGGGIGQMGETCGAVTGACMALGLLAQERSGSGYEVKYQAYALVQEFIPRFREKCGALKCRDLLGRDISDPQQYHAAKQEDLFHTRCPLFINTAVEILLGMVGIPEAEG